ncbi:acyl-CoA thioesterase [Frankia sp. AgKG'84/4]|uniref:acyl-CoA thioesterase n=1 Tax=Frankia sp. AgKG'84/4 TaxID=573490 RepID=UPI00200C69A7|nr:acyl-CoA thioesterase domain-containing protein [Frankia sp. AgKG'84/4]MCL9792993.1 thioesterase family protein [Frankia sp. AgKG'84/4]
MDIDLDAMLGVLALSRLGENRYQAENLSLGGPVVFGGQILAQAIVAAASGLDGLSVTTLHTVFARAATGAKPLEIDVVPIHRGRSFASATVTFRQGERVCAQATALLSAEAPDLIRHGDTWASAPPSAPPAGRPARGLRTEIADGVDIDDPDLVGPPDLDVWSRWGGAPDDPATSRALIAFATDSFLVATAMRPHLGVGQSQAHVTLSTGVLSHTITFHQPCDAGSWLLLRQHSDFAGAGRTHGRGEIFTADGQLVASFTQDGMIRPMPGGSAHAGRL